MMYTVTKYRNRADTAMSNDNNISDRSDRTVSVFIITQTTTFVHHTTYYLIDSLSLTIFCYYYLWYTHP